MGDAHNKCKCGKEVTDGNESFNNQGSLFVVRFTLPESQVSLCRTALGTV